MTTISFQQIWAYARANVACNQCGKISKRRVRDYCTVNPFNRNDDGSIKTVSQVRTDAQRHADSKARQQEASGRICRPCSSATQGENG